MRRYEDANGNKEFDSEDTKIGTLKESDAGYHTAEGLLAKGYPAMSICTAPFCGSMTCRKMRSGKCSTF